MASWMMAALLAVSMVFTVPEETVRPAAERVEYHVKEKLFNPFEPHGIYEDMKIVYKCGDEKMVLKAKDVVDWVRYWPDGHWDIDDNKIAEYVKKLQDRFDTWNTNRTFQTTMGEKVFLTKGDYGRRLDRDKEIKEISRLLRNNGTIIHNLHFLSKDAGENEKGQINGGSYVEIDLSRQVLWLYEKGEVTLITYIVSGMMNTDRQTPSGIYSLKYKQSPAVLVGADYQTPVSYWMPFNGGIGFHDATWQPSFGGDVCYYNGSHGCINLPLDMAKEIYDRIDKGYPVICYYSNPEDE